MVAPYPAASDMFGRSLAATSDYVFIASTTSVHIYNRTSFDHVQSYDACNSAPCSIELKAYADNVYISIPEQDEIRLLDYNEDTGLFDWRFSIVSAEAVTAGTFGNKGFSVWGPNVAVLTDTTLQLFYVSDHQYTFAESVARAVATERLVVLQATGATDAVVVYDIDTPSAPIANTGLTIGSSSTAKTLASYGDLVVVGCGISQEAYIYSAGQDLTLVSAVAYSGVSFGDGLAVFESAVVVADTGAATLAAVRHCNSKSYHPGPFECTTCALSQLPTADLTGCVLASTLSVGLVNVPNPITAATYAGVMGRGDPSANSNDGEVVLSTVLGSDAGNTTTLSMTGTYTGFGKAVAMSLYWVAVATDTDVVCFPRSGETVGISLAVDGLSYQSTVLPLSHASDIMGTAIALMPMGHRLAYSYDDHTATYGRVDLIDLAAADPTVPAATLYGAQTSGDDFGAAILFIDDYIVVGSPGTGGSGAVLLFDLTALTATPTGDELAVPDTAGTFGTALAYHGGTLAVGDPTATGTTANGGAVFLYTWDSTSNSYLYSQTVVEPTYSSGTLFGSALRLTAAELTVSAPEAEVNGLDHVGSVFFFVLDGNEWSLNTTVSGLAADDRYGLDLVSSDHEIIVMSTAYDAQRLTPFCDAGEAPTSWYTCGACDEKVFDAANTPANALSCAEYRAHSLNGQLSSFTPAGPAGLAISSTSQDSFYLAVGFAGTSTVNGQVKIYQLTGNAVPWQLVATVTSSLLNFGRKVLLTDEWLVVSAPGARTVMMYRRYDMTTFVHRGTVSQSTVLDFGYSMDISEDYLIVGTDGASGAEKAFIYTVGDWTLFSVLDNDANGYTPTNKMYGHSVAVSGDFAVVGAFDAVSNDTPSQPHCGALVIFRVTVEAATGVSSFTLDSIAYGGKNTGTGIALSMNGELLTAIGDKNSGSFYIFIRDYVPGNAAFKQVFELESGGKSCFVKDNTAIVGVESGTTIAQYATYFPGNATWTSTEDVTIPTTSLGDTGSVTVDGGLFTMADTTSVAGAVYYHYEAVQHCPSGEWSDSRYTCAPCGDGSYSGVTDTYCKSLPSYQVMREDGMGFDLAAHISELADPLDADESDNLFGSTVLLGDHVFLVGHPNAVGFGIVAIYTYDGRSWSLHDTITRPEPIAHTGALFGFSMAMTDAWLAVGAPAHRTVDGDPATATGSVFVYERYRKYFEYHGQLQDLSGAYESYGRAIAIGGPSDSYMAVGCSLKASPFTGRVLVYYLADGEWFGKATVSATTSDADNGFGLDLVFIDDELIVGAPTMGAVWSLHPFSATVGDALPTPVQISGSSADAYGYSVAGAVNGTAKTLFVGAPEANTGQGQLSLFYESLGTQFTAATNTYTQAEPEDNAYASALAAYMSSIAIGVQDKTEYVSHAHHGAVSFATFDGSVLGARIDYILPHYARAGRHFGHDVSVNSHSIGIGSAEESASTQSSALIATMRCVPGYYSASWASCAWCPPYANISSDQLACSTVFEQTETAVHGSGFGTAVGAFGDVVIITEPTADSTGSVTAAGQALIGRVSSHVWTQYYDAEQPSPVASAAFGHTMALSSTWLAVASDAGDGAVCIFVRAGLTVSHSQTLDADATSGSDYGHALAVDGDLLAVGAPGLLGGNGGVYIYKHATTWTLDDNFSGASATDALGTSVAVYEGDVFAGAPGFDTFGGVLVFYDDGAGGFVQGELVDHSFHTAVASGTAISVAHDVLVVGAPGYVIEGFGIVGAVSIYEKGASWKYATTVSPFVPAEGASFGRAVHVGETFITVGAPDYSASATSAGAIYLFSKHADDGWSEDLVIEPSTPSTGGHFGASISGTPLTLVVGSPDAGTADIFTASCPSGEFPLTWHSCTPCPAGQYAAADSESCSTCGLSTRILPDQSGCVESFIAKELLPADTLVGDYSGALGAFGNVAVLGLPEFDSDSATDDGQLSIFAIAGASWTEAVHPGLGLPAGLLGSAVDLTDDLLVASVPGAASLVVAIRTGDTIGPYTTVSSSAAASDGFGATIKSVAIGPDFIAVGASATDKLFVFSDVDWATEEIVATPGSSGDKFGYAVAIHGTFIAVGAPGASSGVGAVYVMKDNSGWMLSQVLNGHPATTGTESFGHDVASDDEGDYLVVGGPDHQVNPGYTSGKAYVYEYDPGTQSYTETTLSPMNELSSVRYGSSVGLRNKYLAIGAEDDDTGVLHMYQLIGTTWAFLSSIVAKGLVTGDKFASSVRQTEKYIAVPAPNAGDDGQGAAYVITADCSAMYSPTSWLTCAACPSNSYSLAGAMQCTTCPAGSVVNSLRNGCTDSFEVSVYHNPAATAESFAARAVIDGATMVVTAPDANEARIFTMDGGAWSQLHTITATDAGIGAATAFCGGLALTQSALFAVDLGSGVAIFDRDGAHFTIAQVLALAGAANSRRPSRPWLYPRPLMQQYSRRSALRGP
ncbi:PKD domain-containing protein [Carpediemonas membranifera]|uniref:PKD domain-containing protein n=1 Tax=Carpediemonas membranifera TaxID=201153 RepID=A0A8J6E8E2_9EUKA|nr:PKD domain-containing protein [Carpediemonas membranifera]|eukprot:KAG9391780.1 PKD domain-containing protein [Carpediemonas membranifera]